MDLLEKVYDSFYMKYALEGFPLRVPREPLRVVLFDEHKEYLNFVKLLSPALKMAAGFYSPEKLPRVARSDFESANNQRAARSSVRTRLSARFI